MDDIEITVEDNSSEFIHAMEQQLKTALEMVGEQAASHAKQILTDAQVYGGVNLKAYGEKNNSRVDTGRLRNSISKAVVGNDVYIGTNVDYAPYHELGTGIYASEAGGRRGWWVYVEGQTRSSRRGTKTYATREEALRVVAILRSKGLDAHATNGLYPLHFLKKSVSNYADEYKRILETYLKG